MTFAGRNFHDFRDFFSLGTRWFGNSRKYFLVKFVKVAIRKSLFWIFNCFFIRQEGLILPKVGLIYRALSELFFLKQHFFNKLSANVKMEVVKENGKRWAMHLILWRISSYYLNVIDWLFVLRNFYFLFAKVFSTV